MKIRDLMKQKEITLSFEVFPPKTADKYASVEKAVTEIARLSPEDVYKRQAVNIPCIAGQGPVLIGTRSRSVKRAAVLTLQTTQRKNRRASRYPYRCV